uniref:N-acetylglucosaminyl transferase component n=1 Tax=Kalanchoe fedtschenkoi TaxID=63787 RepID=A0A7N0VCK4_KALFE
MRRKCRIWWPKQALSRDTSSFYVLFGWFVSSSPESVDVVVAFASPEASLPGDHSQLLGDLQSTRASMPLSLQDETTFCALGLISADSNDNLPHPTVPTNDEQASFNSRYNNYQNGEDTFEEKRSGHSCNCDVTDWVLKYSLSLGDCKWIMLVYDSQDDFRCDTYLMPKLHHIHWNGEVLSNCDVQVILYEVPRFGVYHLLPSFLSCSEQVLTSSRKPNWLHELYHKKPLIDLGMTIHAINCAAAAKLVFHRNVSSKRYLKILRPAAFLLASCSAFLYILLQLFHGILDCVSHWRFSAMLSKVFCATRRSISIRCSQFLYWPIYLGDVNFRSRSCVEYAEKAALQRHSIWTNMIVDMLLGNAIGLALLINGEAVRHWVFVVVNNLTNYLLRSGCVWLMGVPAGFKLNTELATVLGMICLNTIQIWSTLWFFLGFLFEHILQGLVMLGMVFGITTAAAFIKDLIELAALHVSALQRILSFIYSWQIQSIAFLWRLFRGQKWNPLRQRLDNYDYTVEQHIVGSLLFTSLLLLLPTTSVFYIFFSLVSASISVLFILIEFIMAVVHATPYLKVLLWIVSPRRFPSGIWFKVISSRNHHLSRLNDSGHISKNSKSSGRSSNVRDADGSFSVLVSQLHSNCSTFSTSITVPLVIY